jgi:hypothetical protein
MNAHDYTEQEALAWLTAHEQSGSTEREALEFFDSLPSVPLDMLTGRWHGAGLPTGHPLDGLLESYGWYGKEFISPECVHPLLFSDGSGGVVVVDSRFLPTGLMVKTPKSSRLLPSLFSLVRPLLRTTKARARLRMMEHRGKVSATMIYDYLPINDVFRRVDANSVLGLMDLRDVPQPFFFILRRDQPSAAHSFHRQS